MDLGLKGKVGIVTGAARGIGKAVAFALGEEGVSVAVCALHENELERTAKEIEHQTGSRILPVRTDMTKLSDIKAFVARAAEVFGSINIVVNNAGATPFGTLLDLSDEVWLEAMQLKYLGYVRCIREVTPYLIRAGGGSIINIVGIGGVQASRDYAAGGCTNAALRLLTKVSALELGKYNIRANAIHPGSTETQRVGQLFETRARLKGTSVEEERRSVAADVALGRLADPREIADVVLFLASDRSAYVTGAEIRADGGMTKGI